MLTTHAYTYVWHGGPSGIALCGTRLLLRPKHTQHTSAQPAHGTTQHSAGRTTPAELHSAIWHSSKDTSACTMLCPGSSATRTMQCQASSFVHLGQYSAKHHRLSSGAPRAAHLRSLPGSPLRLLAGSLLRCSQVPLPRLLAFPVTGQLLLTLTLTLLLTLTLRLLLGGTRRSLHSKKESTISCPSQPIRSNDKPPTRTVLQLGLSPYKRLVTPTHTRSHALRDCAAPCGTP